MARKALKKTEQSNSNPQTSDYLSKIESDIKSNQSKLSMVLGALIILVVGILIYNYFNKNKPSLGPAQQTQQEQEQQDISPEQLPGKYTVKDGDTLFNIADKYYHDGYKYNEIVKANNLANPDLLEKGQVLNIPKLENQTTLSQDNKTPDIQTQWGPKIEGTSYTVVEGDFLSQIAGRAYGDPSALDKLIKANNLTHPDLLEAGTVLIIPR